MSQDSRKIRVALADKNPLIQAALRQLLSEDERFELVHVSATCEEFLEKVSAQPVDVGVIGWIIGSCDGRAILDQLSALGYRRKRGESRESFAARMTAITPTFNEATRQHLACALGGQSAQPQVRTFNWNTASKEISTQVIS